MRVGIAGLGKMGSAMAARLVDTGMDVVAWNRNPSAATAAGLVSAATPRALAAECEIVLSSLFDETAVSAVYDGPDGLLAGGNGKLFVEMSTVSPEFQTGLARNALKAGAAFIECPVSGTTGPARSGQLVGLPGGDAADVERAVPVLEKLCRRIEYIGPVGSGATAKLAINLPLLAFWQSFGEAMALMRRLGKEPAWLVRLFSDTAGTPAVMKVKANAIAATLAGDTSLQPTYDIDSMRKDLRLMLSEASEGGFSLPVAKTLLIAFDEASQAGLGKRDCAFIPAFWAKNAPAV